MKIIYILIALSGVIISCNENRFNYDSKNAIIKSSSDTMQKTTEEISRQSSSYDDHNLLLDSNVDDNLIQMKNS